MEELKDKAIFDPLVPRLALNQKDEFITLVDGTKPDLEMTML